MTLYWTTHAAGFPLCWLFTFDLLTMKKQHVRPSQLEIASVGTHYVWNTGKPWPSAKSPSYRSIEPRDSSDWKIDWLGSSVLVCAMFCNNPHIYIYIYIQYIYIHTIIPLYDIVSTYLTMYMSSRQDPLHLSSCYYCSFFFWGGGYIYFQYFVLVLLLGVLLLYSVACTSLTEVLPCASAVHSGLQPFWS